MNSNRARRAVVGSCLIVAAATAGRVRAQPAGAVAEAERLFDEARELARASRWAEACPKFEASLRADPALGTRLNLATCYENLGQLARAWALFHESAEIAERAGDAERRDFARSHAEALEPRLGRLTITAPADPPAGFRVTRDGAALDAAELGAATHVDPGRHEIAASAPGFASFTRIVTTAAGKTETVEIPRLGATASASTEATPAFTATSAEPAGSVSQTRAIAAVGLGAAGLASVGVGLLFGANARSRLDEAKVICGAQLMCEGDATYRLAQQSIHDARSEATASTVLVIAGGAAIAAGVVLFVTRPSATERGVATVVPIATQRSAGLAVIGSF